LENSTISFPHIRIVNMVANWSYIGLVIICFILVLGDRPRTSKWGYTFIVIGFAAITVYTTIAALLLTITGIRKLVKEHNGVLRLEDFWTDQILRNYVLSLTATYGLYLFPSFIFVSGFSLCITASTDANSSNRGI
jgi:chitin synthase